MMDDLMDSELVSRYKYVIVSDAKGTIFCKQNCIPVTGPIKQNFSPYYPAPRDYMEDFSFVSVGKAVELYIGDVKILTLTQEELKLMLQHMDNQN